LLRLAPLEPCGDVAWACDRVAPEPRQLGEAGSPEMTEIVLAVAQPVHLIGVGAGEHVVHRRRQRDLRLLDIRRAPAFAQRRLRDEDRRIDVVVAQILRHGV
jgi:hypothetical protein